MGRVNQLWQDQRERRASALVADGMGEGEAWELAACDSGSDRQAETAKQVPGEASQSGDAASGASPIPSQPPTQRKK